jgi:hypothetical protein
MRYKRIIGTAGIFTSELIEGVAMAFGVWGGGGGVSTKMYQAFSSGFYLCSITTSLLEALSELSKIVLYKLMHIIKYESRLDQII